MTEEIISKQLYYLNFGTGEAEIVLAVSRENIITDAWWIPSKGESAFLGKSVFDNIRDLKIAAENNICLFQERIIRLQKHYNVMAELPALNDTN